MFSIGQEEKGPKSDFGPSHGLPSKWLLLFCRPTGVVSANTPSRRRSCSPCCACCAARTGPSAKPQCGCANTGNCAAGWNGGACRITRRCTVSWSGGTKRKSIRRWGKQPAAWEPGAVAAEPAWPWTPPDWRQARSAPSWCGAGILTPGNRCPGGTGWNGGWRSLWIVHCCCPRRLAGVPGTIAPTCPPGWRPPTKWSPSEWCWPMRSWTGNGTMLISVSNSMPAASSRPSGARRLGASTECEPQCGTPFLGGNRLGEPWSKLYSLPWNANSPPAHRAAVCLCNSAQPCCWAWPTTSTGSSRR